MWGGGGSTMGGGGLMPSPVTKMVQKQYCSPASIGTPRQSLEEATRHESFLFAEERLGWLVFPARHPSRGQKIGKEITQAHGQKIPNTDGLGGHHHLAFAKINGQNKERKKYVV